ncbi:hypothetical protein KJ564_08985, partial [bacterium]|nr:hypothetical protein [bacterium]
PLAMILDAMREPCPPTPVMKMLVFDITVPYGNLLLIFRTGDRLPSSLPTRARIPPDLFRNLHLGFHPR